MTNLTRPCGRGSPPLWRILLRCKHLLALLCLLFGLATGFAVSGIILDEEGSAISGATISDGKKTVRSASDGSFKLSSTADSIYVSRIGYHPAALNLQSLHSPIMLKRDAIVLPTIWVRAEKPFSPSLNAQLIHPDTNASAESASDLLLQNSAFSSTDIKLSGERQTLNLLGSFNRHSLVMLDGVVLNPAGEAFDLSKIPLAQISHIEIIKGNSSVYGGSAAIGGIIHLHSKDPEGKSYPELNLSAHTGSFGFFKQSYEASFSRKALSLNAEYSHQDARNDYYYDPPAFWGQNELKRRHNRKTADSFFLKSSFLLPNLELAYSLNTGSFIRQLPGTINFLDLYDASRLTGSFAQHNLKGVKTFQRLLTELLLWRNTDQSTYQNLGSTNPFASSHYQQQQLNHGIKASSKLNLEDTILGLDAEFHQIDYEFENLISKAGGQGKRENSALALRAQHSFYPVFGDYKVSAAVRGDYGENEIHPTWRLEHELTLPVLDKLLLGGYIGTAFAQPSLFDMYWIGDSETQGNPNLRSEKSLGYNLYSELNLPKARLRLAWYQNWVDQLIQWRQYYLNGVSWKPFNVGSAELQNLELDTAWVIGTYVNLNGSVTFTKALDVSLNPDGSPSSTYEKHLVYTPALKAILKLSLGDDKRGATLSYSYTGEQYSTVDNLIAPLPPFDLLDAALFYRISLPYFDLRLDLKANNLLNKRYDIYAYTPQPGFNWQTGLSISTHNKK